ncbi:MAG: flagellar hook-length control protein FliK, partial [Deltaproteobacteria bacterium]|nr:flagellar hook-length control protein FliK [Deltaproteobacteria bacterium]
MLQLFETMQASLADQLASRLKLSGTSQSGAAALFSQVLAARAGEVSLQAKLAESPPPQVLPVQNKNWQRPVEAVSQEVDRYGYQPQEIVLPPEQKENLAEFLSDFGLSQDQTEEVIQTALRQDGKISLGSVMQSLNRLRLRNIENGDPSLPAGLAPKLINLVQKMGLIARQLDRLTQELGQDSLPLRRVARILASLGQPNQLLEDGDVTQVKDLLLKAGLSPEKVEQLVESHLDSEGQLSLKALTSLLDQAAGTADKGLRLVRSGQLRSRVAQLLKKAEVVEPNQQVNVSKTAQLADRLKKITAQDQKMAGNQTQKEPAETELRSSLIRPSQDQAQFKSVQVQDQVKPGMTEAGLLKAGDQVKRNFKAGEQSSLLEQTIKNAKALDSGQSLNQTAKAANLLKIIQGQDQLQLKPEPPNTTDDPGRIFVNFPDRLTPKGSRLSGKNVQLTRTLQTESPRPSSGLDQVSLTSVRGPDSAQARPGSVLPKAAATRMQPSVLLDQLSGRIVMMLRGGQQVMRLQLYPPELGGLKIDLRVEGQAVRATVVAENQQVQQLLGAHSSELKQSLSEQGFSLEKFEVMTQGQNAQTNSDLAQDGRAIESKAR